jgi:hypothetical protein
MNHERQAHKAVRDFMEDTRDKGQYPEGLPLYTVVTVAASYILGNEKYWITTDIPDGRYYECTYDAGKDEMYVDAYVRIHNEAIKIGSA